MAAGFSIVPPRYTPQDHGGGDGGTGFPSGGWGGCDARCVYMCVHGRFTPHKVWFGVESIGSADHLGRVMVMHGRVEKDVSVSSGDGILLHGMVRERRWAEERHAGARLV